MSSENNLKALYSYLFTLEEEIDRKLYRAKRETKRLHTIYDSIKPKENGTGYTNKLYTSIIGYMPSSDPQVLIYVIVDSAQGGEIWGNTVAAPIFKEISIQIAHILNLQPDKTNLTFPDKEKTEE